MIERPSRQRWSLSLASALVAIGLFALQLILLNQSRLLEWDEATYVSQLTGGWVVPLGAHRARGVVYLVAPVVAFSDSMWVLRAWLSFLSASMLGIGVWLWTKEVGWAAIWAGSLIGMSWVTIFFGSEVQPNAYVAFSMLIAAAVAIREWQGRGDKWQRLLLGLSVAFVFLLRPPDGLAMILAFGCLWMIVRKRGSGLEGWIAFALGAFVGFAPWLVEAQTSYGGVLNRVREAGRYVRSGLQFHGLDYLQLADGPMQGPEIDGVIAVGALFWLVTIVCLSLVGWLMISDVETRKTSRGLLAAGVVLALPYMFYVGSTSSRFLLPSYALVSVVAGLGITTLWKRRREITIAALAVALGVSAGIGLIWNMSTASTFSESEAFRRSGPKDIGEELIRATAGQPCVFASQFSYPVIALVSGCEGGQFVADAPGVSEQEVRSRSDANRLLLFVHDPEHGDLGADWAKREYVTSNGGTWYFYELPADAG